MLHQTWWWHTELQEEESQVTPGVTAPASNRDGEEEPRDIPHQGEAPAVPLPSQHHSSDSSCSVHKVRARVHRTWPMVVPPHTCALLLTTHQLCHWLSSSTEEHGAAPWEYTRLQKPAWVCPGIWQNQLIPIELISDTLLRLPGRLRACGPHLRTTLSRAVSQECFTKIKYNKDMQVSEAAQDRSLPSRRRNTCARFQKDKWRCPTSSWCCKSWECAASLCTAIQTKTCTYWSTHFPPLNPQMPPVVPGHWGCTTAINPRPTLTPSNTASPCSHVSTRWLTKDITLSTWGVWSLLWQPLTAAALTASSVAHTSRMKLWALRGTELSPTDLTLDVVAITQATKLLLASCVPYIKFNRASVSMEDQRMNFNTQRC